MSYCEYWDSLIEKYKDKVELPYKSWKEIEEKISFKEQIKIMASLRTLEAKDIYIKKSQERAGKKLERYSKDDVSIIIGHRMFQEETNARMKRQKKVK